MDHRGEFIVQYGNVGHVAEKVQHDHVSLVLQQENINTATGK